MTLNLNNKRVYVAGHNGMVGSAVVRELQNRGISDVIRVSRQELDLCDQAKTNQFYRKNKPEIVIFAAGRVGGIHANNSYPAEFIYENLMMAANSIQAAFENQVQRFLFLGSTCIYPRMAPQPMNEDCLLTSPLEKTNEAYAVAKIAGLKLCEFYRKQYGVMFHSVMPTNLYGPGDNYHLENSHVLPALIRRFHEARIRDDAEVVIWGSGRPKREFLHVDDLAKAVLHMVLLENPPDLVNVGTGKDITIRELAELVAEVVGFAGKISTDPSKLDGTPRKCTDISLIQSTGWQPTISLQDGLRQTYKDFLVECQTNEFHEV